ncbi:uncharacterized protein V1518DRAFT_454948 [Limtongia smithiae]|uniref:uncharacterized protein n=1 Tax=Limtongia smithiae TaxID=1125753 RepID=UPI0034CFED39
MTDMANTSPLTARLTPLVDPKATSAALAPALSSDTTALVSTADRPPQPFNHVVFYISRESEISPEDCIKARKLLLEGGATEALTASRHSSIGNNNSDIHDVANVTHIIANNIDFPEYLDAEERMINVVKLQWVLKSAGKAKSLPLRFFSPNPRYFFSDVCVLVIGLPHGDKEAIYGGVRAMGGQWSETLTRFTTHVITLPVPLEDPRENALIENLMKRPALKVILPHWVDSCLKLRHRVQEEPYLFPDPPLLSHSTNTPIKPAINDNITYIHSAFVDNDKSPPKAVPESIICQGKRFYLGADLKLSPRFQSVIRGMIEAVAGSVVNNLEDATVYLGNYRAGDEYIQASRRRLFVGTLMWLYWMVAHDKWQMPMRHLLHYPKPKTPVPGMENFQIAVSGYTGESRLYLENLIHACGAKYTRTLRPENTHLIAARRAGQKYEATCDWNNIEVVNHLWLEETYVRWEAQRVSEPRYSYFPPKLNLMDLIGQTRLDVHDLRKFYGIEGSNANIADDFKEDEMDIDKESPQEETTVVTSLPQKNRERPFTPIHQNRGKQQSNGKEPLLYGRSAAKENTPKSSQEACDLATSTSTTYRSKSAIESRLTTTSSTASPVVPASAGRRAKSLAAAKLKDDILDLNVFEQNNKLKGVVVMEDSNDSVMNMPTAAAIKKRKSNAADKDEQEVEAVSAEAPAKKKGKSKSPAPLPLSSATDSRMQILLTGYGQISPHDLQKLYMLGIDITESPEQATHIASPKLSRTEKFLCALPRAPIILSADYIQACLSENARLSPDKFALEDKDGEEKNKCDLATTLARAKTLHAAGKRGVFDGMIFNVVAGVKGGVDTIRHIITANGGACVAIRSARAKKYGIAERYPMILIASLEHKDFVVNFAAHAQRDGRDFYAFSTEWILTGVLRMQVKFDDEFSLVV